MPHLLRGDHPKVRREQRNPLLGDRGCSTVEEHQRGRPPVEDVLDPVFRRMGVPPMIVVIPDGNYRYGCGQWIDSPVSGSFGSYVARDVVSFVDSTYRTIANGKSRGCFGFSSGGM